MKIAIFGCGWLGKQLALSFIENGHDVVASYRTEADRKLLSDLGIQPVFLPDLEMLDVVPTELTDGTDIAIISIPPPRKYFSDFYHGYTFLLASLENVRRILYTSSTGVYPKKSGWFSEEYSFSMDERQDIRIKLEGELQLTCGDRAVILRLGGLFGPNRHPLKSLAGRKLKGDGQSGINLIHSRDVVEVINKLIVSNAPPAILNVCFPSTWSKKEFYCTLAGLWGVDPPVFGCEAEPERRVDTTLFQQFVGADSLMDPLKLKHSLL